MRLPLDVLDELEATAARRGRTVNEEIVSRLRAGADPYWQPAPAEGQQELPIG